MRRAMYSLAALALVGLCPLRADTKPATKTVKAFRLDDSTGKAWAFADAKDKKAVVVFFLGTECTVNNQYSLALTNLANEYSDKGVAFVGINSNAHDTPTRIAAYVKEHKIPFAVLKDSGNVVGDDFGAKRTPEAFVLSPAGNVMYQGRIDDQIGIGFRRKEPTRRDVAVALDEILAGKAVSKPATEVSGCLIARAIVPKATGKYTYTKDIARILQNRCQECHRAGHVAPMALSKYEDALSWQGMIREVIDDNRMPPWHADPKHGTFDNARVLSAAERETILTWIKDGCPKGDPKDLPAEKSWPKGWMIGKPDVVFDMPTTFDVPAKTPKNGISYKYYTVKTNFDEDRWVQAAEARPGAREVVHHIIVYVTDAKRGRDKGLRKDGIGNGFLTAYAPGDMPLILKPGQAKKLPKGATLVFQMHYTPDGIERNDRSSVGLIFAKELPKVEVRTRGIAQQLFRIPAEAKDHPVASRSTFAEEVELLTMLPHMHVRGKSFEYVATYPDGKTETLLSVPRYDFNWQSNYRLTKPLKLPAGTRIDCRATFDNSDDNPNNPDSKSAVYWGDQTWQEMMIGFVDYAVLREEPKK